MVRPQSAKLFYVGSSPIRYSKFRLTAYAVDYIVIQYAPMVELVDTLVLEASASASEFESRLGHH